MKRLIIVPVVDIHRFHGFQEVCRDHSLAALVGDSRRERSREHFSSEELFLEAAARGDADRYSFHSVEEATAFAREKLEMLNRLGRAIEDSTNQLLSQKMELFLGFKQIPKRKRVRARGLDATSNTSRS